MHHIYDQLQLHLERHPIGFPKTPGRRELDILKRIFTQEEAEIALNLMLMPEKVEVIAARAKMGKEETAKILAGMANKGIIFEDKRKGEPRYALLAFIPGIYEFQVHNIDDELAHAFEDIYPHLAREMTGSKTPWMRVLPTEVSMTGKEVIPYQHATEVIKRAATVCITDCICRKEQKLNGHGCSQPVDSMCLYFTPWAEFLIDKGIARKATVDEALKVIKRAENAGLVHLAVNVQDDVGGMCQCCPCCCGVMRTVTEFKIPTGVAKSDYYATTDIEQCTGCESCVMVCPVKAITMDDAKAVVNTAECLGCGVCVVECPNKSMSLVARPEPVVAPPRNWRDMLLQIAREKGRTYFFP